MDIRSLVYVVDISQRSEMRTGKLEHGISRISGI